MSRGHITPLDEWPDAYEPVMQKEIVLPFTDRETRKSSKRHFPLWILWGVYSGFQALTARQSFSMFIIGAMAAQPTGKNLESLHGRMMDLVHMISETFATGMDPQTPNEQVIDFTYALLKRKKLRHDEAAVFASAILGTPISTDAWRMRLNRWIEKHNLPKIEQRRRKPQIATNEKG